ncbi:MAG: TetR/AcrR family transcriptional regulator [Rhodobacteraceae bacterium]|nr:TetR/AcrR family transcriptional regulator [Paracoccaceae bacterium]
MARPTSFDRDAAIETAMQELWRHGYEASSVKKISELLGITRSSYYNAFGTREELFKLALAAYGAQSPDRVLCGDLLERPILVLLTAMFRQVCAVRAADPEARGCLFINSLCELGGEQSELGQLLVDSFISGAERLEELLDIAVRNGELPGDTDTHAKALCIQNLLIGLNTQSKAVHDEDELWLVARTMLEGLGLYRE